MFPTLAAGGVIVVLFIAGFVVLVAGIALFAWCWEKKRREKMQLVCSELGFEYAERGEASDWCFASAKLFGRGHGRRMRHVMSGRIEDLELAVFDYRYTIGSGKNSSTHHQTVASLRLPDPRLPRFHLAPEHLFHRIGESLGFANDLDFEDSPEFSKKYHLNGDDEPRVRELFTPEARRFFEEHPGWTIEGADDWLIMYRASRRQKPEQVPELVETITRAFLNLSPA